MNQLTEYVKGQIWVLEYPVHFFGMDIASRMTLIRLADGALIVHSPCKVDASLKREIDSLGNVRYIIAPGNYHHLFVPDFQQAYPEAETFICPGLERKKPELRFDWVLGNRPDPRWGDELEQVLIQGTKFIWEVAFFHKSSKTLILVDLLENVGDAYIGRVDRMLKFYWKVVFRMWNNPKAAPEYQVGWGRKDIVRRGLEKILSWDADRVMLSHGDPVEGDVSSVLRSAWRKVLDGR